MQTPAESATALTSTSKAGAAGPPTARPGLGARLSARCARVIWSPRGMALAQRISPALLSRIARRLTPDDFAGSVGAAPREALEHAMRGRMRRVVLDEVVRRMQSEFVPERATGMDAVIQMEITGRPDGGSDVYQLTIREGTCRTSAGASHTPKVTLTLDAVDFLRLASGAVGGIDLYLRGQLKFDGQAMMLTRLTSMFRIPTPKRS